MALNRAGKADEAQIELASFQKLEQSSVKQPLPRKAVWKHLRQGKYAEAIAESLPLQAPSPKVPQYTDVAVQLGVNFSRRVQAMIRNCRSCSEGSPYPQLVHQ